MRKRGNFECSYLTPHFFPKWFARRWRIHSLGMFTFLLQLLPQLLPPSGFGLQGDGGFIV